MPRGLQNYLNVIAQRAKVQGFVLNVPSLPAPQFVRLTLHTSSLDSAWLAAGTIERIKGTANAVFWR